MLIVAPVKQDLRIEMTSEQKCLLRIEKLKVKRSERPAVTHVDYSARVQTVHKETNPRHHALLGVFEKETGCGVVVNTSFNVRGEPIVCTPQDADRCFMRTGMGCLDIEGFLLDQRDQPEFENDSSHFGSGVGGCTFHLYSVLMRSHLRVLVATFSLQLFYKSRIRQVAGLAGDERSDV